MRSKIFSVLFALVLVLSLGWVMAVPAAAGKAVPPDRVTAITQAADRLVTLQNADGGFPWVAPGDGTSYTNILGVSAMGILKAWEFDAKAEYNAALAKAYKYCVDYEPAYTWDGSKYIESTKGVDSFPDITFLVWLSQSAASNANLLAAIEAQVPGTAAADIATLAKTRWDDRVTYLGMEEPNGTATGMAQYIRDARHGQNYDSLIPWDLEAGVKAAQVLDGYYPGQVYGQQAVDIAEVIYSSIDDAGGVYFSSTDQSQEEYVAGLTGGIEAFQEVGLHLDKAADLKTKLSAIQQAGGYWNYYGALPATMSVQSTAYAVMALFEEGSADAISAANRAAAWLAARQRVDGGWFAEEGAGDEYAEINSEAAWALARLPAPVTVDGKGYYSIQAAIYAASPGDTIVVAEGTYDPFTVVGRSDLTIQSASVVNVSGLQVVTTNYTDRDAVVFVSGSTNIRLQGLNIGPNSGKTQEKDYGIIYEESSGEINNCTVAPDTSGDMASIAVGIWDGSEVSISGCTMGEFGRIGVFIYNGCTVDLLGSTIEGQVYNGEGEVCYGVEVEGAFDDATPGTGSQVTITSCEIFNCDNTFDPEPSWLSAGIYINGWLEYYDEEDSTVSIENNNIHHNYIGISAIKSPSSFASYNDIHGNRVRGVEGVAAHDASTAVFDAINNWWGNASGPIPPGTYESYGDKVSTNVNYQPWLLEQVVPGVAPTTYTKTLALKDNWTMVSVDKEVTTGTAWVGTDALADTETILAYKYTAGTGYTQITMATQLTSVDAFYVKTDGGGGVGINYSSAAPGVVTKDLGAGWNTISCAGETDAYTLLTPLRHAQIGQQEGTGLTNLIGQGAYNQFTQSISRTLVTDAEWAILKVQGLQLSPFDGYWVYMNATKSFGVVPD